METVKVHDVTESTPVGEMLKISNEDMDLLSRQLKATRKEATKFRKEALDALVTNFDRMVHEYQGVVGVSSVYHSAHSFGFDGEATNAKWIQTAQLISFTAATISEAITLDRSLESSAKIVEEQLARFSAPIESSITPVEFVSSYILVSELEGAQKYIKDAIATNLEATKAASTLKNQLAKLRKAQAAETSEKDSD